MVTPNLGSMLLASADPNRLSAWYRAAFEPDIDDGGFLRFGDVAVLIDHRGDVADRSAEPGRIILNFHVDDARAIARHLGVVGVTWLTEVEQREDGLFGTLLDPDGNIIQIIELSASYLARHHHGDQTRGDSSA